MAPRRTLPETRAVVIEAGLALLQARGVRVAIDHIAMIDACRRAGLRTAGSAYKIWPTQADFRADLLRALSEEFTDNTEAVDRLAKVAADLPPEPDSVRELVRTGGALDADAIAHEPSFHTYLALWSAAATDPAIARALTRSRGGYVDAITELYEGLAAHFGLEFVPPFTARHLGIALNALAEGMAIVNRYYPDDVPTDLPLPTSDGGTEPWHLFSAAALAIVERFTRPKAPA